MYNLILNPVSEMKLVQPHQNRKLNSATFPKLHLPETEQLEVHCALNFVMYLFNFCFFPCRSG